MSKKRLFLFFLPFLMAVPIIIVGTQQEKIIERLGSGTFGTIMTLLIISVVVVSILPFIKIFKGFFSGRYGFFWGRGALANQVLQSGTPAIATVKSIGENSGGGTMTINGQPVLNLILEIQIDSKPPYEVSFDTIVSRSAVPQFQPGASFAVRVDPNNLQNVVFDSSGTQRHSRPTVGGEDWTEMDIELLQNEGIDGMAKIISINDTGQSKDFQPVVKVVYEVFLPGESSYTIERELALPTIAIQKLQGCIGKTYKARVHPYNKERMVVNIDF